LDEPTEFAFEDRYPPDQLWCSVYGAAREGSVRIEPDGPEEVPTDLLGLPEPGP
jgi:hypothetical protein